MLKIKREENKVKPNLSVLHQRKYSMNKGEKILKPKTENSQTKTTSSSSAPCYVNNRRLLYTYTIYFPSSCFISCFSRMVMVMVMMTTTMLCSNFMHSYEFFGNLFLETKLQKKTKKQKICSSFRVVFESVVVRCLFKIFIMFCAWFRVGMQVKGRIKH